MNYSFKDETLVELLCSKLYRESAKHKGPYHPGDCLDREGQVETWSPLDTVSSLTLSGVQAVGSTWLRPGKGLKHQTEG